MFFDCRRRFGHAVPLPRAPRLFHGRPVGLIRVLADHAGPGVNADPLLCRAGNPERADPVARIANPTAAKA